MLHRAILLILFAGSAGAAVQQQSRVTGCYRFPDMHGGYFAWVTYDRGHDVRSLHRSMLVQLEGTPHAEYPNQRILRVPGLQDSSVARIYAASGWQLLGADSVAITWTDGHGGLRIRAAIRGDSLVGMASHFADVIDGRRPVWFPVAGARITCPAVSP